MARLAFSRDSVGVLWRPRVGGQIPSRGVPWSQAELRHLLTIWFGQLLSALCERSSCGGTLPLYLPHGGVFDSSSQRLGSLLGPKPMLREVAPCNVLDWFPMDHLVCLVCAVECFLLPVCVFCALLSLFLVLVSFFCSECRVTGWACFSSDRAPLLVIFDSTSFQMR